jgi:hypothetical protein
MAGRIRLTCYDRGVNRGGSPVSRGVSASRCARWQRPWVITLLAALLLTSLAWAGSRMTVRDSSGSSIGRIDEDGVVRDRSGSTIGRIDVPGSVRDRSGSTIGRVDGDGTIRQSSGSTVGRVDDKGTLRDRSGSTIGRLDGCTVRSASGSTCGRFDGCVAADRLTMAAYLFFFERLHER